MPKLSMIAGLTLVGFAYASPSLAQNNTTDPGATRPGVQQRAPGGQPPSGESGGGTKPGTTDVGVTTGANPSGVNPSAPAKPGVAPMPTPGDREADRVNKAGEGTTDAGKTK